jgi:hypothetical protein
MKKIAAATDLPDLTSILSSELSGIETAYDRTQYGPNATRFLPGFL